MVNGQIPDSIAQAGIQVLGSAPAMAMASLYQGIAMASTIVSQNAVLRQQHSTLSAQAAAILGGIQMYSRGEVPRALAAARRQANTEITAIVFTLWLMQR